MTIVYRRGEETVEVDGATLSAAIQHARKLIKGAGHDFRSYRLVEFYPQKKNVEGEEEA